LRHGATESTTYDFEAQAPLVGPPTNKNQCKDGGWQTFNNPTFKNQGDCMSYVATGGKH
jgi:glucuronoarabinoxylan endo-1,4-beta-xylanase